MPRNYRTIDRDVRVERLLSIAADQFMSVGYAKTKMSDIARLAGLTSGTVYWYFESKDDVLAAVQHRILAATREQLQTEPGLSPMTHLERYLEIMRANARPLHRVMHERAPHSAAVAEALGEIHGELEEMIRAAVTARNKHYPELDRVVQLSMAVIEGTSAVQAEVHSSELLHWVIENLVPDESTEKPALPRKRRS